MSLILAKRKFDFLKKVDPDLFFHFTKQKVVTVKENHNFVMNIQFKCYCCKSDSFRYWNQTSWCHWTQENQNNQRSYLN